MALIALTIDGEVGLPRGFTLEELRLIPDQVDCRQIFGRHDVKALPLITLIEPLGVKPRSRFAVVRGGDRFVANVPVHSIHRYILVYGIGGLPLWTELGGPARLFAPGLAGCADVAAVSSITLSASAAPIELACQQEPPRSMIISPHSPRR